MILNCCDFYFFCLPSIVIFPLFPSLLLSHQLSLVMLLMCFFWFSSSFNLLLFLGCSFGNHIAKPVRISDEEDGPPNKDPRKSFLVEFINDGGLCRVDVGCSEVSFVSFLVLSCFLIKQMSSKQSDNMSLKRSEVPFFCILISCISRQLEIIDPHFCLHASPFRKELACKGCGT